MCIRNMAQNIGVFSLVPRLSHYLRLQLPNLNFLDISPEETNTLSNLETVKILVADCDLLIPYINKLSSVKWVQSTWAGVEKLLPHLKDDKQGFILTRFCNKSLGLAMSEYVIAQIVNFERDQQQQYENRKNFSWLEDGKIKDHRLICDLNIGILGLGNIGKCIAERLKMFGARIWGITRNTPKEQLKYVDEHRTIESLSDILKNCDYIINVLPSTVHTIGLLNGDTLKHCEDKQSVFINIGRGTVIDETDLIYAIQQKWISAAILDVFQEEPLPKTSALWKLPQVIISPHNSGVSRAKDIAAQFVENYNKYIEGKCLSNIFDWHQGY